MRKTAHPMRLGVALGIFSLLTVWTVHASAEAPAGVTHVDPPTQAQLRDPAFVDTEWVGAGGEELGTLDTRVPCVSDGVSGKRVEVLYARPSDGSDRFATFRVAIQRLAANVSREFMASAGETKGTRQIRYVTNAMCRPVVRNVALSIDSTVTEFNSIVSDLASKGFNSANRIYLVFLDGDVSSGGQAACGVAGGNAAPGYAILDAGCWSDVDDHELAHALGAVHSTAPHSSLDGHCTDRYEMLCGIYGFAPRITTYPCRWWHHELADCGHDDYFHTNPPVGSFLKNNPGSNIANSPYFSKVSRPVNDNFAQAIPLRRGILWGSNVLATRQPGEPITAGSPPAHSIWFTFAAAAGKTLRVDTYASSVDTVLGIYKGTLGGGLTLVGQNDNAKAGVTYSSVTVATTEAVVYRIRVDGKSGAVGSVRVNVNYGDDIPTITGITPSAAPAAEGGTPTVVRVNGTDLVGDGGMILAQFNGWGVGSYEDTNPSFYDLGVSPLAIPGPISIGTSSGATASDISFRLLPRIASFNPASGPVGTSVEVKGTGFVGTTLPAFAIGSQAAALQDLFFDFPGPAGFVATIEIPAGAATGKLKVTTPTGTHLSAGTFTVTP